jgi:hypothetical protein
MSLLLFGELNARVFEMLVDRRVDGLNCPGWRLTVLVEREDGAVKLRFDPANARGLIDGRGPNEEKRGPPE